MRLGKDGMMLIKMYSLDQIAGGKKRWYMLVKWAFIWCLKKTMLGDGFGFFNWRKSESNPTGVHEGIDIGGWCDYEHPVYAAGSGKVTIASTVGGYGYMIEIDHGYNVFTRVRTRYGHLRNYNVRVGQMVKKGDIIATVGGKPGDPGAGHSTEPHTHFELGIVSANGSFVRLDPMPMMPDLVKGWTS